MLGTRSICVQHKDPQKSSYPTSKCSVLHCLVHLPMRTIHQECCPHFPPLIIIFLILPYLIQILFLSEKFLKHQYCNCSFTFPVGFLAFPNFPQIICVWREGAKCNRENARYSPNHQIYLLSTHKDHMKWGNMTNFDQCDVDANDRYYCQTWLV